MVRVLGPLWVTLNQCADHFVLNGAPPAITSIRTLQKEREMCSNEHVQ